MKKLFIILSITVVIFAIGATLLQSAHFGKVLDQERERQLHLVKVADKVKFSSCSARCARLYPTPADYNNFLSCMNDCHASLEVEGPVL